ncbi:hypothetical protein IKO_04074 [Bacillus cereus VDM034]|nr:hypothetical protein IKO_04074 [Bacillus cereus VDM034]
MLKCIQGDILKVKWLKRHSELYPESWTLKKSPMIRGFCVFLSKNLVIMEPTIEMRYGEWVKLFLTKFK